MRVLVVEDDVELAEGISLWLRGEGDRVEVVGDGAAAAERLVHQRFDVALIDVGLPGQSGYELVRGIRSRRQNLAVILITARDALSDRIYGLELGADDYLAKPFELPELRARMRAVLRRGDHLSEEDLHFGPLWLQVHDYQASLDGVALTLTPREWTLLRTLAAADGRTVAKERLLAAASSNALEVYISRLRPRLATAGLVIRSIRGFGYRLERQPRDTAAP
ncbi:MAG: response regulator transcription factor [Rhodocyclaceae bacterium]|nr:response regulator transcription factor [Rhodocyclaceae bacterium]